MTESKLGADELVLIQHLRDVPPGTTRDELLSLVGVLIDFVRDPRCPRAQADGVPCGSTDVACEDCRRVAGVLAFMRHGLQDV